MIQIKLKKIKLKTKIPFELKRRRLSFLSSETCLYNFFYPK